MNLGIDARLLYTNTGIGRYTRSLFFEYTQPDLLQKDTLFLFNDTPFPRHLPSQKDLFSRLDSLPADVNVITAACKRRILWTNRSIPPLLRQHQIDVYHGVCNFELPIRKMCRYVVTIHDLVPHFFPELVPWKHLLFFKLFMKRAAHTADLIITDSHHSKHDIAKHLAIPEEKIRVIYLGCDVQQQMHCNPQTIPEALTRYGIRQPYLLFVGVLEPKKNLERLVDAFLLLRQETTLSKEVQLVMTGGKGWFYDKLYQKVRELQLQDQIVFTGFVPDADLPYIYSGAKLFVFPSIYEGFGLPVLEAMSYGIPVVTSTSSSLPEIAGEAGILVDPNSAESIAQGILSVLSDEGLQEEMKQKGRLQVQKFSWQQTAEQTYNVYQEVYKM